MKKILFAASECVPFIKTGGLADVCGALPKEFDPKDWDVRVVIPNYSCIPEHFRNQFEYVTHFYMGCGSYIPNKYVGVLQYKLDGITYYFIDNQEYFNCFVPYGDVRYDIEKFCFFDKAVLSMLPVIGFRPDIIHCHDWQAGLIPVYLKNEFQADSFFWGIKSIMTIHNLKFQGVWDVKTMQGLTGFSSDLFTADKLEFNKDANMLKGGIAYSNKVTTVSNTYAWEIQTEEYGEGLAEKIATADSLQARSQLFLQTYLQQFPESTDTRHNLERYVRRRIYETKGTIGIQNLAEETGYSACYLRRVFEQIHGISPKLFERFIRFQNMLYLMEQQEWQSQKMDALCFESGYYDQSHMMKDFKRFAGRTPEQYRKFRLQPEE